MARRKNRKKKPKHTTRFVYRDKWYEMFTGEIVKTYGYSRHSKRKSRIKEGYSVIVKYRKFKAVRI